MVEYVRGIIIAGTACSMAMIALPKNAEGCGRYCRYLSSLIILAVILSPLRDVSALVTEVKDTLESAFSAEVSAEEQERANAVVGTSVQLISEYIIKEAETRFGFSPDATRVRIVTDESSLDSVIISEIQIFTDRTDHDVLDSAEEYFAALFDTDVLVLGKK